MYVSFPTPFSLCALAPLVFGDINGSEINPGGRGMFSHHACDTAVLLALTILISIRNYQNQTRNITSVHEEPQ